MYVWGDSAAAYDRGNKRFMRHQNKSPVPKYQFVQDMIMVPAPQVGGNLIDLIIIMDRDPLELILKNTESIREAGSDRVDGEPATKVEFVKSYDVITPDFRSQAPESLDLITVTLWFGNKDFLIKKAAFSPNPEVLARSISRPGQPENGGKVDVTVRHKKAEVNPRFFPDDIQFRPPKDAVEKPFEIVESSKVELKARKLDGKPAPVFVLKDTGGKEVKLSDYKGKVVLLEFWASWNDACLETMKSMQRIHDQFKEKGFEAVGVNTLDGEDAGTIRSFLTKNGITHRVLMDTENSMGEKYGFTKIPACFLLDKKGVVRVTYENAPNEDIMKKVIEKLLKE
jgi:peroxiredoxin